MTRGLPALELRAIDKRYGTVVALAGASLSVRHGTLHVLLGENGAGKTTLLRIAAGLQAPDAGEMFLDGNPCVWKSGAQAIDAGVAAVHQHLSLVPAMTVAENVALAQRKYTTRFSPVHAARRVRDLAELSGLDIDPEAVVERLSVAAQQRAEILKAISHDPRVLILDEPTAVLSPSDSRNLFLWLRGFVSGGRTAIVITHRIREAMKYGDALTILRRGRTVLAGDAGALTESDVLAAILGEADRKPDTRPGHVRQISGADGSARITLTGVSVRDATGTERLRDVSLCVNAGEILGVAGIEGAGHYELLRVLAGRMRPTSGTATLPASVGFIPEDRLREALIGELPLVENFALRGAGARRGIMRWKSVAVETHDAIVRNDVRSAMPSTLAGELSGGNQQKFILARELDASTALVAENPARGLDVRAAASVVERLRDVRAAGAAVVVYSSDIDQLLEIADRVVVCHAGSVHAVPRTSDAIGAAMVGAL